MVRPSEIKKEKLWLVPMKPSAGVQDALVWARSKEELMEKLRHAPHYVSIVMKQVEVDKIRQISKSEAQKLVDTEEAGLLFLFLPLRS